MSTSKPKGGGSVALSKPENVSRDVKHPQLIPMEIIDPFASVTGPVPIRVSDVGDEPKAERLLKIAKMHAAGYGPTDISRLTYFPIASVVRDLEEIDELWRESAVKYIDSMKNRQLRTIDMIIADCADRGLDDDVDIEGFVKLQKTMLAAIKQQSEIAGTAAPIKHQSEQRNVNVNVTKFLSNMTNEDLERLAGFADERDDFNERERENRH